MDLKAINTAPDSPMQIDLQSGRQAYLDGDYSNALRIVEHLIEQQPRDFDGLLLKGACLLASNDFDGAEQAWLGAVEVDPRSALPHTNLGILYIGLSRRDDAIERFKAALSNDRESEEAAVRLIVQLKQARRLEEAEWYAKRAIAHAPASAMIFDQLGQILQDEGKLDEAEAAFRNATKLNESDSNYALHLAYLLLSQGRWTEGFQLYERRHADDLNGRHGQPPRVAFAQWKSESLRGKSLLIWPDQGFGDQIQTARYIHKLRGRGAVRITLVCDAPLQPLFANMHGVNAVLSPEMYYVIGAPAHDFWVFGFSIPFLVGDTPSSIPKTIPYLKAPKKSVAKWQAPLRVKGLKIGLAWQGNADNPRDRVRSLPDAGVLDPLGRIEGATFVSLQRDSTQTGALPMLHFGEQIVHFADLAGIIAHLDLVITVDTAVAHLAGAMGKPTWVLLSNVGHDWRWGHEGSESAWYPGVMRLFRQTPSERDWSATIERVVEALSELR